MSVLAPLAPLRAHAGRRLTAGLDDATIERLATDHPTLRQAIEAAGSEYTLVQAEVADLLDLDEDAQISAVQDGFINFYADDAVTPYVALAARGPWVITLKGAVLYDAGGYGMLGFGHTPEAVLDAMARPQVMANVMTPSLAQRKLDRALRAEIGHTRGGCPFARFMCLNSGSEAVGLAARIVDTNASCTPIRVRATPAPPSSAWWSRAASTAAPIARGCIPIPAARPTASTWPATATKTR